jgi:hypothetical protein
LRQGLGPDLFVARVLDLPLHAPIGEVRRGITNQRDRIVYLRIARYRGDMVVFNTTIEVPRGGIQGKTAAASTAFLAPLAGRVPHGNDENPISAR